MAIEGRPDAGRHRMTHRTWRLIAGAGALAAVGMFGGSAAGSAVIPHTAHATRVAVAQPLGVWGATSHWAQPPTTGQCIKTTGLACYRPAQFQQAYDLKPLYASHLNGRGRTIIVVDSFGSPTIKKDLAAFDTAFHLPAPHLTVLQPVGKVPPFNPKNGTMVGWAAETTLDVEYSHAMAPGANIVLLETPVAETEGTVGFPQIVAAENYAINHHLGDVISQSFGATEETFPSVDSLLDLRSAYINAAAHHISVLASSGDFGVANARFNGVTLYTHRVTQWPSTDPLVTSVGGLQLHLNAQGDRTLPDNVWNDTNLLGSPAAGGGGRSAVFARPSYQNGVANRVGLHRGTPDISLSAAVDGSAIIYLSFLPPGFYTIAGTSEACPQLAGIVAIADQAAGYDLGLLNPRLYAIGSGGTGIPDITIGNNTVTFTQNGRTFTVPGFEAVRGYDMASGLGTVDAAKLVAKLTK
jgi:subtilase family serine protease